MRIGAEHFLILSVVLFSIGMLGVLVNRNLILILMNIELMLNAGNILLVSFARYLGDISGQVYAFLVMVVAACEVAVGLAIILALFRNKDTVDVERINILKW